MFKTILIYELIAFAGWNIMARTEADYEKWIYENIHGVVYITLATTMLFVTCLLYTSPSPRDRYGSRMPSSA